MLRKSKQWQRALQHLTFWEITGEPSWEQPHLIQDWELPTNGRLAKTAK